MNNGMDWLNYHHLLYFWTVAREGGVSRAAEKLRLSQPTISAQLRLLEDSFGEQLFTRQGRSLVLTEVGQVVFRYADEIFSLGRELTETLRGRPAGRPLQLTVGIANVVPEAGRLPAARAGHARAPSRCTSSVARTTPSRSSPSSRCTRSTP